MYLAVIVITFAASAAANGNSVGEELDMLHACIDGSGIGEEPDVSAAADGAALSEDQASLVSNYSKSWAHVYKDMDEKELYTYQDNLVSAGEPSHSSNIMSLFD